MGDRDSPGRSSSPDGGLDGFAGADEQEDLRDHTVVDAAPPQFLDSDTEYTIMEGDAALEMPLDELGTASEAAALTSPAGPAEPMHDEPTALDTDVRRLLNERAAQRPDPKEHPTDTEFGADSNPSSRSVTKRETASAEVALNGGATVATLLPDQGTVADEHRPAAGGPDAETAAFVEPRVSGAVPVAMADDEPTALQPTPAEFAAVEPPTRPPSDPGDRPKRRTSTRPPSTPVTPISVALSAPVGSRETSAIPLPGSRASSDPKPFGERPPVRSSGASVSDVVRFGRYVLFGKVGVGGMAEVRLACQTGARGFVKPCVIKRIVPEYVSEPDYRDMFLEEARICSQLSHPGIVHLYEYDEHDGVPYMAMELVDGVNMSTLDALAGDDGLPLTVIVEAATHVTAALQYAHELENATGGSLNIIHRDVSPQNILISRQGDVKLADFGIARFDGRGMRTGIGPPKGKLRYMSPEQLRYLPLDHRVDLFGLGVVLAEMATGKALMPDGALVFDDFTAHVRERLESREPRMPGPLVELILRLTAFEADGRPATAKEAGELLGAVLSTLDDRVGLFDFAATKIAPNVPSAEDAIFSLLGAPDTEGDEATARSRSAVESAVRPVPILAEAGVSESFDGGGFPTTSHFMLAAEKGLSGADADVLGGILDPVDALGDTFMSDEPGLDAGLPGGIDSNPPVTRESSALGDTYVRAEVVQQVLVGEPVKPRTSSDPWPSQLPKSGARGRNPTPSVEATVPDSPRHETPAQLPVVTNPAVSPAAVTNQLPARRPWGTIVALLVGALVLGIAAAYVLRRLTSG